MSPDLYVQMVRIDKVKKLLLFTGLPLKTGTSGAGCESVSAFVSLLKARTWQTIAVWYRYEVMVPATGSVKTRSRIQAAARCPLPAARCP